MQRVAQFRGNDCPERPMGLLRLGSLQLGTMGPPRTTASAKRGQVAKPWRVRLAGVGPLWIGLFAGHFGSAIIHHWTYIGMYVKR